MSLLNKETISSLPSTHPFSIPFDKLPLPVIARIVDVIHPAFTFHSKLQTRKAALHDSQALQSHASHGHPLGSRLSLHFLRSDIAGHELQAGIQGYAPRYQVPPLNYATTSTPSSPLPPSLPLLPPPPLC
ncbi:hypothetical protein K443DRAFT_15161 [Laccaria amethystina LaAM-08-1]|uniref:Uncharacterized protein n=1 Tax=Laccaria amethystina LaAM-08-1 TaxID=1095629 RepID=A0A0C9WH37_9AGAR|nr:hypothetical protein K443DRAFT_15161 [Laccaria amethystina LaAM-08-1]